MNDMGGLRQLAQIIFDKLMQLGITDIQIADAAGMILTQPDLCSLPGEKHCMNEVMKSNEPVCMKISPDRMIEYIPLIYQKKTVGVVIIAESPDRIHIFSDVARVTSELLLENHNVIRPQHVFHEDFDVFMKNWLYKDIKNQDEDFFAAATIYGIDLSVPRLVVLMQFGSGQRSELATRYLRKGEYLLMHKNNEALIVGKCNSGLIERISRLYEFNTDFRIFVGAKGVQVHTSFQSILEAESICTLFHIEDKIVYADELAFEQGMMAIRSNSVLTEIRRILEEKDTGHELRDTLRVFFLCSGNNAETCKRLIIHRNTLSYRLARIKTLTGKDAKNYRELMLLYSAVVTSGENF